MQWIYQRSVWGQGFCYLQVHILEEEGKELTSEIISESVKNMVLNYVNNKRFVDRDCLCISLQPQSRPQDDLYSNPSTATWHLCDPGMPRASASL